jgi:hypothetical protein
MGSSTGAKSNDPEDETACRPGTPRVNQAGSGLGGDPEWLRRIATLAPMGPGLAMTLVNEPNGQIIITSV